MKRPALRYHGGKWRLAPWILGFFPPHRVYVEPFGGGASVLLRKPRAYAEVYNDLDGEIVNVFRVLRDPAQNARLQRLLELTPFARVEFADAYTLLRRDAVERARVAIVKCFMGFSADALRDVFPRGMRTTPSSHRSAPTGFRHNSMRSHTTPAHNWAHYPSHLGAFAARLAGIVIEQFPAERIIRTHDRATTLFYCDPPYVHTTRRPLKKGGAYRHEMTDEDHRALAAQLRRAKGMVVISGYPSALYDRELYPDWTRHEKAHLADGARRRTEVVWLNARCAKAARQGPRPSDRMTRPASYLSTRDEIVQQLRRKGIPLTACERAADAEMLTRAGVTRPPRTLAPVRPLERTRETRQLDPFKTAPFVATRTGDVLRLRIETPPRTKKNHGGNFGRTHKAYRRYRDEVALVVATVRAELQLPLPSREYNLAATYVVDRYGERADRTGLDQGLFDVLQYAGVVTDDWCFRATEGTRIVVAAEQDLVPCVELTITPLAEGQAP